MAYVGSTGVEPTAFGSRVEPINEVVHPGGCWDGEVGSKAKVQIWVTNKQSTLDKDEV